MIQSVAYFVRETHKVYCMCLIGVIAVFLSCSSFSHHAVAQDSGLKLLTQPYFEEFTPSPLVKGGNLVGLRWSEADGPFDPDRLMVSGTVIGQSTACVSIASVDGSYFAENLYEGVGSQEASKIPSGSAPQTRARLANYMSSDIAVLAQITGSCDGKGKATLALPFTQLATKSVVEALLNVDATEVEAGIVTALGENTVGKCEKVEGLTFNWRCRFANMNNLHSEVRLTVRGIDLFGQFSEPISFDVFLDRGK